MKTTVLAVLITITIAATAARADALPSSLSSANVLGVHASYNLRDGYRKFDGVDKYLRAENTHPFMFGGVIGRRFALSNPRLRIQAAAEGGWGNVKDTELRVVLANGDNVLAELYSEYATYGVTAEMHALFPLVRQTVFLSCGPGLHNTYFSTTLKDKDGKEILRGATRQKIGTFSPSGNIGIGVEQKNSARYAMALAYNFRFWRSAHYIEVGALFPMGVEYSEYFFTHALHLQVLLPNPKRGGVFH